MRSGRSQFANVLISALLLAVFLLAGSVSVTYSMPMGEGEHPMMPGCVFAEKMAVCQMNLIEHLTLFTQMVSSLPAQLGNILALLASVLAAAIIFIQLYPRPQLEHVEQSRTLYVKRTEPHLLLFSVLIRAFSDGILHPKLF